MAEAQEPAEVRICITVVPDDAGAENTYFRGCFPTGLPWATPPLNDAEAWRDVVADAREETDAGQGAPARSKKSGKGGGKGSKAGHAHVDGDVPYVPRIKRWTSPPLALPRDAATAVALARAPHCVVFAGQAGSGAGSGQAQGEAEVSQEHYQWFCPLDVSPLLDGTSPPVVVACGRAPHTDLLSPPAPDLRSATPPRKSGRKGTPPASAEDDTAPPQAPLTLPDLGLPTGAYLYTPPSALSTCVISVQCVGDPLLPPALREELNPLTLTVAATHHLPGTTLSQPTPGQVRAFLCPNRYSHTASVCQAPRLVGRLFGAALPELDRLILTPRVQWSELTSRVTPADPAALVGSTPFTAAAADDSDSSDDEAEAHGQAGEVADSRESLTAFPRIAWSHRTTVLLGTAPADSVREALLTHPLTLRLHDRDAAQAALDEGAGPLPAPRRPDPAELESIPQDPADADQAAAGAVGAVDVSGTGQLGACAWPATAARLGALLSHLVQDQGADSAPSHPAALPESAPVPTPPPPGVTAPWAALARVDAAAAWEVLSEAALSGACHPHGIARLRCEGLLDSSAAAHRALTAVVAQGAAQRASLETAAQQQQQQAAAQRRLSQFHSRGGVAAAPDADARTVAQPAETEAATAMEVAPSCISLSASVDMLPRRRTAVPRGGEDAPGLSPAQALARDTAAYTAVGCRTVVSFSLARPLEAGVTGAAAATGSNTNTVGRCVLVTRYQDDSALRQVNALLQSLNTARMTAHLTHEQAAKAAAAAAAAATSARASPRGKGKRSGRKQRSPRDDEKAAAAAAAAAEAAAREVMAQTASAARPGIAGVQVERLAAVELAPEETAAVHAGDLDILTAWQVVDRHWRIIVVEGREVVRGAAGPEPLAPGEDGVTPIVAGSGDGTVRPVFAASMQVLRAVLGRQWANSAQRKLLSNPDVRWRERLYVGTNLTLDTTHLGRRLARIVQGLDTYSADPARSTAEAATAARKLFELRRAQRLWTLKQCRLFPTRRELAALALREGATVTHEDMEGRVARQADIDASVAGLGAAAGRRGTTLPSSIADTSTAWGGGGAPAEGGGGDTTVASQGGAPPPTRRSTSRTSRKEATVTTFREYDALSSALATARQGVDFLQRNKDAVGHLSAQLTSALEATGQSRAQQRQLPPDVLQAMQSGQAFSYSGQSRSVMQAQRAAHTAMAARDTKHAYVYADSSAAGGLLGATVPRADPDTEAAAEAAAAAAAALTPSGFAYPKPTPIAQKRRHAKAPKDAHSAAFREPYMDAAEQAARQREAERQQVLAVGGHRPGWGHAPMVGREFGYKNPATGEDESARFNTSVHAASDAAKQVAQQTARAEAEAWAQRVVVDAKQVKWRGHSTPHAAPGTADKYKPLLADAPATLALRAAHAAKTPSGKVHALYEDRLAVDTVHRDAGASQEHLHTSTQALHPAQPPHDAAKLVASASAGSLRDAGLRAISALAGQQGVTPLALSFRGRTPDGPSNASLTSGAGAGLTRRGAWASGLLKSPQLATATGLSPRRQTSGAGPFSPIVTSQSRSAADVLHKPHIQPLPAALRSGPQWG